MNKILFTRYSGNRKTGPMAVTTSSKKTCPKSCPLIGKCYASFGSLNLHWSRVTRGEVGSNWKTFLSNVKGLHAGEVYRMNQAGDLEGKNNLINSQKLAELVAANRGKKPICYTHYPVIAGEAKQETIKSNISAIKHAVSNGFTINLSGNNLAHADKLVALNIAPVVVILDQNQTTNCRTPAGNRVVVCPASVRDNVTCLSCKLCARANREYVIGFPAHGVTKKYISQLALSKS